jgi:hypothetical protein
MKLFIMSKEELNKHKEIITLGNSVGIIARNTDVIRNNEKSFSTFSNSGAPQLQICEELERKPHRSASRIQFMALTVCIVSQHTVWCPCHTAIYSLSPFSLPFSHFSTHIQDICIVTSHENVHILASGTTNYTSL